MGQPTAAFIVAEMNLTRYSPTTPMTLEFVDQVKMKVLLNIALN